MVLNENGKTLEARGALLWSLCHLLGTAFLVFSMQFGVLYLLSLLHEGSGVDVLNKSLQDDDANQFIKSVEDPAKNILGIKLTSEYAILPDKYSSPAATMLDQGRHVLGVNHKFLELIRRDPDAAAAIIAHEVGHQAINELRMANNDRLHEFIVDVFGYIEGHGLPLLSGTITIWVMSLIFGRKAFLQILLMSVALTILMACQSDVLLSFNITTLSAVAISMVALFVAFGSAGHGRAKKLVEHVRGRILVLIVLIISFVIPMLIWKPALLRRMEIEADAKGLQVMTALSKKDSMVSGLCWLEKISPTADYPVLEKFSDHPGNDERLHRIGVREGLRACSKI